MNGTDWRHPFGPKSSTNGLDNHPVVHVAYNDALANAQWQGPADRSRMGVRSPRRPGRRRVRLGAEFTPGGQHMADTWQGNIPRQKLVQDGFERTSPVTAFPTNVYGVCDMIGIVCGMDQRLLRRDVHGGCAQDLLHSGKFTRQPRGRELRPLPIRDQDSATGPEGRLALARPQLLPSPPSGGASPRVGRHLGEPCRLSICAARQPINS